MTFISEALQNIIGDGTATAFAKKAGVSQGNMSRWISGIHQIEAHNLAKLTNATDNTQQKLELVQAWIRDQIPGVLGKSLQVSISDKNKKRPKSNLPKLSPQVEETLCYWWREAAKDPQVGIILATLRAVRR